MYQCFFTCPGHFALVHCDHGSYFCLLLQFKAKLYKTLGLSKFIDSNIKCTMYITGFTMVQTRLTVMVGECECAKVCCRQTFLLFGGK